MSRRSATSRLVRSSLGSVAVAAALGAAPASASTDDATIASAALLAPERLGDGWTATNRLDAPAAAIHTRFRSITACKPFLRSVLLHPVAQRAFTTTAYDNAQRVWIYPSATAASNAMKAIATRGFAACEHAYDAAVARDRPPTFLGSGRSGKGATATSFTPPKVQAHGDRQVVIGQRLRLPDTEVLSVLIYIQFGRGVVLVMPEPDMHDSLAADGQIERTAAAATAALAAALTP